MQTAITSRVSGCNTVPCTYHSTLITQKRNLSVMFENFISTLNNAIAKKKSACALSQEELADLLKTNPEALRAFENSYESFTNTHPANSIFNKPARNEQNGSDFYIIDMAMAERSAYYNETVPAALRHVLPENWLPDLSNTET